MPKPKWHIKLTHWFEYSHNNWSWTQLDLDVVHPYLIVSSTQHRTHSYPTFFISVLLHNQVNRYLLTSIMVVYGIFTTNWWEIFSHTWFQCGYLCSNERIYDSSLTMGWQSWLLHCICLFTNSSSLVSCCSRLLTFIVIILIGPHFCYCWPQEQDSFN